MTARIFISNLHFSLDLTVLCGKQRRYRIPTHLLIRHLLKQFRETGAVNKMILRFGLIRMIRRIPCSVLIVCTAKRFHIQISLWLLITRDRHYRLITIFRLIVVQCCLILIIRSLRSNSRKRHRRILDPVLEFKKRRSIFHKLIRFASETDWNQGNKNSRNHNRRSERCKLPYDPLTDTLLPSDSRSDLCLTGFPSTGIEQKHSGKRNQKRLCIRSYIHKQCGSDRSQIRQQQENATFTDISQNDHTKRDK